MANASGLSTDQIGFLTFEGGGSNGLTTHPGAVRALTELGVLKFEYGLQTRVEGFAGSSSGSFTSALVASGFDAFEVTRLTGLDANDLSFRNESLRQGTFAALGGQCVSGSRITAKDTVALEGLIKDLLGVCAGEMASVSVATLLAVVGMGLSYVKKTYPYLAYTLWKGLAATGSPDHPLNLLKYDYGLFSGCAWRDFIDYCIAFARYRVDFIDLDSGTPIPVPESTDFQKAASLKEPFVTAIKRAAERVGDSAAVDAAEEDLEERRHTTFAKHHDTFFRHVTRDGAFPSLAITGANTVTQESHVFSRVATPGMLVADAIRIATGLPFLFKPFVIKSNEVPTDWINAKDRYGLEHYLVGAWVDGGLYYNSPFDLFDPYATPSWGTLGLGINFGERCELDGLTKYIMSMSNGLRAFESNVSATRVTIANFIELKGGGLGYVPTREELGDSRVASYQTAAYQTTFEHFASV